MRMLSFFLFATLLSAHAEGIAQNVTISGKNLTLNEVFAVIKKQTGYVVFSNKRDLAGTKTVTVSVVNAPIRDLLDIILKDQPLEYTIQDKTIVLSRKPSGALPSGTPSPAVSSNQPAPPITIRVLDSLDRPVSGASVQVKNRSSSGVTNAEGLFTMNVNEGDILLISFISMETRSIKITRSMLNNSMYTITLKPVVRNLEEVTVTVSTGYQTISKERSAGSFAKPDMKITKDRSGSMNILQRLDGLIPGLTINNAPNLPFGATVANPILVRGLTTIGVTDANGNYVGTGTNRSPLYVVDGIQMDDVSTINPQDVAEITVLKDATAASIWGSRASNGVVVIVTQKGGYNEKLKIVYDGFLNFQGKPDLDYFPVLSTREFIDAFKTLFNNTANGNYASLYPWNTISAYSGTTSSGVPPHEVIMYNKVRGLISAAQADASLDSLAAINNRDQIKDLWYRNASLMNHTLSLSGGGRIHSFYGSLTYTDTRTNRPGDENKTYKINLRQDFNFNKRVQAYLITDLTTNTTSSKRNLDVESNFYPYQLFRDASGNNLSVPYMKYLSDSTRIAFENRSRISLNYVPLDEYNYGYTKSDGLLGRITSGISISLFKGLKFEGVYGFVKGNNKIRVFDDANSYTVRSEIVQFTVAPTAASTPVYYLPTKGGRYTVTNTNQRNWTVRNQLIYDNAWKNRMHQLTLLAGQEAQEQLLTSEKTTVRGYDEMLQTIGSVDYLTLSTTGVPSPVMPNNIGRSILPTSGGMDVFVESEIRSRFTSYYANGAYTYRRKYTLNGSWRIDQSNLFGKDRSAQNRPVWSTGVKWLISNEQFIEQNFTWFDQLALRVTYGITGISPSPGTASSFDIMQAGSSNFLPGGRGLSVASPANTKLTWERTETVNIGLDLSLLKNRISGSIDLYRKMTTNLLGNFEVNGFSGYSVVTGNIGDMENKGIEIGVTTRNIMTRSFSWSTYLVASYNRNLITRLNTPTPISTGIQKVASSYLPGYAAFAVFAYNYAGLDAMGDPQVRLSDKTVSKTTNITKPEDILYMGTYQPVWSGGLSNTWRYKGLSLAVNAVYNLGHVMRKDVGGIYSGRLTRNINPIFYERWQNPGDEAYTNVPSYVTSNTTSNTRRYLPYYTQANINVLSASFIKLRDVTLSYDLPRMIVRRMKTDGISFRIQASNIMVWKANKAGIDPEFHNALYGNRTLPVNQRTVSVGAHIVF